MTITTKNLLSILFFAVSLLFLMAASNIANSAEPSGDCHHCGSVSACDAGGQPYGYHDCWSNPGGTLPDNCVVLGPNNCGDQPEPPGPVPVE